MQRFDIRLTLLFHSLDGASTLRGKLLFATCPIAGQSVEEIVAGEARLQSSDDPILLDAILFFLLILLVTPSHLSN